MNWKKIIFRTGVIILGLFAIGVAARVPYVIDAEKTAEAVAKIHATKLTMADIMGENLPPEPDPALKDATIAGIDANENGIRDDVELAIFKLYPNSARIRSAALQYALGLELQLTVRDSKTLVAALQEKRRGYFCLSRTVPSVTFADSDEKWRERGAFVKSRTNEVENLVFNNQSRKDKRDQIFDYMTSHGDIGGPDCDIDPNTLSN